jgi:hypothetical protein
MADQSASHRIRRGRHLRAFDNGCSRISRAVVMAQVIESSDESSTSYAMYSATNKMSVLAPILVADEYIDKRS